MNISVNGEPAAAADGASVAELVDIVAGRRGGVAVAVNEDVVPRTLCGSTATSGSSEPGSRSASRRVCQAISSALWRRK